MNKKGLPLNSKIPLHQHKSTLFSFKHFSLARKNNLLLLLLLSSLIVLLLAKNGLISILAQNKSSHSESNSNTPKDNLILAEVNNMSLLDPTEYAVVTQESDLSLKEPTKNVVTLSQGGIYTFETSKTTAATLIEGSGGVATFVSKAPEVSILDQSAQNKPEGKIDPSLLKKNGKFAVIIRFSGLEKFYSSGDSTDKRAEKRNKFNDTKSKIAPVVTKNGKFKEDLLIINGVSAEVDAADLTLLEQNPLVDKVELDREYKIVLDESLDEIKAREVWTLFDANSNPLTGVGKRIAIIDTGVDYNHADLGGCFGPNCKVIDGRDFVNGDSDPQDDNGHGTHVAATAAGNGLLKGVAPDAQIIAYKVCNSGGSCPGSAIISAIDYATDPNRDADPADHVDVASMSLGGGGNPDDSMSTAVDNSTTAGVVHTIAAGNSGPSASTIMSPGTSRTAITVAAACKASQIGQNSYCNSGPVATFNSRGPLIWNGEDIQKPDIAAPGVLICAARWDGSFPSAPTCFDTEHMRISGTSMATPHVAGAAALIRQAYPDYSPAQVKLTLKNTARDLGTTYDAQGAGMVDLRAAIPISPKVAVNPGIWEPTTDPSNRLSTTSQLISVTPTLPDINTLTITAEGNIPGGTLTSDKETLQVAGQTTDTFTATLTVDNDTTKSGRYTAKFIFSENGETKGILPIYITVRPTISLSVGREIDYGIDDPSLPTWNSEVKPVTVTNLRTDVEQTVNMTSSGYPPGATFNITPATLTVPASGTASFDTSYSVDNSQVANGIYTGKLEVKNSVSTVTVSTKFTKYYVLIITDENLADLKNAMVWIHDRVSKNYLFVIDAAPKTVYLDSSGNYDIRTFYSFILDAEGAHENIVVKEGIPITQGTTTVNFSRNEAVNLIKMQAVDSTGVSRDVLQFHKAGDHYAPKGFGLFRMVSSGNDLSENYISNVSDSYTHLDMFEWPYPQPALSMHYFYGSFTNLSGNLTYTNTPDQFNVLDVQFDINKQSGNILPLIIGCYAPPMNGTCAWSYNSNNTIPVPQKQTIYSLMPEGTPFKHISDNNRIDCPASGACSSIVYSPFVDPRAKTRSFSQFFTTQLAPILGGTQFTGLGPSFWALKFANANTTVRLSPYFENYVRPAFLRQDFALSEYAATPYTLFKDSVQVASGNLPAYPLSPFSERGTDLPSLTVTESGNFEFKVDSFTYQIDGQNFTARVLAKFDTRLSDPNPPAIKRLYYFANNARSEVYDETVANRVEFEFDAIGSTLTGVATRYSTDGTNFTDLPVIPKDSRYVAAVPSVTELTKMTLQIEGVDSAGNSLTYTFELPHGTAPPPGPDIEAPVTQITYPTPEQLVSGSLTVTAEALDDVGVTKVELYMDSQLAGTTTVSPYSFPWDTTTTADGTHTLTSRAYDAAGNVTTSPAVSVVVDNTAPEVNLTQPVPAAFVSGTVTITATATDTNGVTRVEFYVDDLLLLSDSTAPYESAWDTITATDGQHALTARAADPAGNSRVSPPVTVTVDNTRPSVSITQPAAGAQVSGEVTITAEASDTNGVGEVKFLVDGNVIATDTTEPYSASWNTLSATLGSHTLTAQADDVAGNSQTSTGVSVTVVDTTSPSVTITSPKDDGTVRRSSTVTIAATATDDRALSKVEFFVNGVLRCTDTSSPYTCNWKVPSKVGVVYTIQAVATDQAGNKATHQITVTSASR